MAGHGQADALTQAATAGFARTRSQSFRPPTIALIRTPASLEPQATMHDTAGTAQLLHELEARQDEVLRQLDDLNQRIEQALRDCGPAVIPAAEPSAPS
jgi:hypothetical protein